MRLFALVLATALLAFGCSGDVHDAGAPTDAGRVTDARSDAEVTETVAGTVPVQVYRPHPHRDAGTAMRGLRRERLAPPARLPANWTPPRAIDPAVKACIDQPWADWDALDGCLRANGGHLPSRANDAGTHLLGGGTARPPPRCSVQSVPSWFIDPVSGNDNNTGTSNVSALKTYAELTTRWGCGGDPTYRPHPSGTIAVTFLTSQPGTTDRVIFDPILDEGSQAYLIGQWTQIATGTIASLTPKSTTAADGRLTVDLGAAALGHVGAGARGQFVVNTSRSSSVAAINEVLSGTTVALTQPMASNAPAPPTRPALKPAEFDTWTVGDTWQLMQLPSVYVTESVPTIPENDGSIDQTFEYVEHIFVPDPIAPGASVAYLGQGATWTESWIDAFAIYPALSNAGGRQIINTTLGGGAILRDTTMAGGSMFFGGMIDLSSIDGDAIINDSVQIFGTGAQMGRVCAPVDTDIDIFTQLSFVNLGLIGYGDPHIYGTYELDISGSSATAGIPGATLAYDSAIGASGNFLGTPTWLLDNNPTASAKDLTHTVASEYPGITISAANLDTGITSGGFGGVAYGYAGSRIAPTNLPTISAGASPLYVAGSCIGISAPVGGPVTFTNTCPSSGGTLSNTSVSGPGFWFSNSSNVLETIATTFGGDVSQGTHFTGFQPLIVNGLKGNAVPALSTGFLNWNGSAFTWASAPVTSVSGTGATTCSPTTGAVVCNTPSVTVSGGSGVTVTGGPSYTASVSAATANALMVSTGSPGFTTVAPGAASTFLMSNGAVSLPSYDTPITTFYAASPGNTVTVSNSIVAVTSIGSITTTASEWLTITAAFFLDYNRASTGDTFTFGVGVDTNTGYTKSRVTECASIAGTPMGITPTTMYRVQPGAGTHTIYALCNLGSAGSGQGVDADLTVLRTKN